MRTCRVGILGATGLVGQQYVRLLHSHPFFEVVFLAASNESAGKKYAHVLAAKGMPREGIPSRLLEMPVHAVQEVDEARECCELVFSALSTEAAKAYEALYAAAGLQVISNAGFHRMDPDVPLIVPEINSDHLKILPQQRARRGWKGSLITKPNCSLQGFLIPLYPLHRQFGVKRLIVTTMQSVSGAGYPGIPSLDIIDNVIPLIPGEEEKSETEPLKILGSVQGGQIRPAEGIKVSMHCNRVPVLSGHMACVSVEFELKPSRDEILTLWREFTAEPQRLGLPSAPRQPILYTDENDRPQPRLDREAGGGMASTVGRLRECRVFDYRFVCLSHNVFRGAAKGGVLNAELLYTQTEHTFEPPCL